MVTIPPIIILQHFFHSLWSVSPLCLMAREEDCLKLVEELGDPQESASETLCGKCSKHDAHRQDAQEEHGQEKDDLQSTTVKHTSHVKLSRD